MIYVNLEAFAQPKKPLTKMKRQSTEWEKIFANDMTHKGLISSVNVLFFVPETTVIVEKKEFFIDKPLKGRVHLFSRS